MLFWSELDHPKYRKPLVCVMEGHSDKVGWHLKPSVGTWLLPTSVSTAGRTTVVKLVVSERPRRSASTWQDLMKYLSLPEQRRARTIAMAAKMARQQLQKAMERSRHYRKVVKPWTPQLITVHEGCVDRDDGTTFLQLFDREIGWYVKQVPRPLLPMPSALPGAAAGPKKEDMPPPPPCRGGIVPSPPSEPPKQHAMRRQRQQKGPKGDLLWVDSIQPTSSHKTGAVSALTSWIVRMGLRCLQDDLSGSFRDSLRWADNLLACTV